MKSKQAQVRLRGYDSLVKPSILCRAFYERGTITVAKELLGKFVVRVVGRNRLVGRIVEVEAYRGFDDPASHAFRGITPRTAPEPTAGVAGSGPCTDGQRQNGGPPAGGHLGG